MYQLLSLECGEQWETNQLNALTNTRIDTQFRIVSQQTYLCQIMHGAVKPYSAATLLKYSRMFYQHQIKRHLISLAISTFSMDLRFRPKIVLILRTKWDKFWIFRKVFVTCWLKLKTFLKIPYLSIYGPKLISPSFIHYWWTIMTWSLSTWVKTRAFFVIHLWHF